MSLDRRSGEGIGSWDAGLMPGNPFNVARNGVDDDLGAFQDENDVDPLSGIPSSGSESEGIDVLGISVTTDVPSDSVNDSNLGEQDGPSFPGLAIQNSGSGEQSEQTSVHGANPLDRITSLAQGIATRIMGSDDRVSVSPLPRPTFKRTGPRRKPGRVGAVEDVNWDTYEDAIRLTAEKMLPQKSPMEGPLAPTNETIQVLADDPYKYRGAKRVQALVSDKVAEPEVKDGLMPDKKRAKFEAETRRRVGALEKEVIEAEKEVRRVVYQSPERKDGFDALFAATGMNKNEDYRLVIDDVDVYAQNPNAVSYEFTASGIEKLELASHHFGRYNMSNLGDVSPDKVDNGELTRRDLEALDALFFIIPKTMGDRPQRADSSVTSYEQGKDSSERDGIRNSAKIAGGFVVATQYLGPDYRDRDNLDNHRWSGDVRHLTDGQMNRSYTAFLNGMTQVFGEGVAPIYVSPLNQLEDTPLLFKTSVRSGQARIVAATHEAVQKAVADLGQRADSTRLASESALLELGERTIIGQQLSRGHERTSGELPEGSHSVHQEEKPNSTIPDSFS